MAALYILIIRDSGDTERVKIGEMQEGLQAAREFAKKLAVDAATLLTRNPETKRPRRRKA